MSPLYDHVSVSSTETARLKEYRDDGYTVYFTKRDDDGGPSTVYLQRPRGSHTIPEEADSADTRAVDLLDNAVGKRAGDALRAAGYDTLDAARSASDDELSAVEGFGPASLKKLRGAGPGAIQ